MALPNIRETKRTTLKDVAEESGVSVSTVSAVLSGSASLRRISPDVARRVREVASDRGYSPNRLVHSLQQGRTNIVAFYSAFRNRWKDDMYMDKLAKAIELAAGARRYDLLTLTAHERTPEETFAQMNGGWADGLIFFGVQPEDPLLPLLRRSSLPTVLLQDIVPDPDWPRVRDDEAQGLALLADALLECGHREVAVIYGRHRHDTAGRMAAFRREMARRGVEIPDEHVVRSSQAEVDDGLREILALPRRPTAVFTWNDRLGYKLLEACDRAGVSVPGRLSLAGYDGIHWPSTSRHVLTSVAVDLQGLTRAAVELLDQRIGGDTTSPAERIVPVSLRAGTTLGVTPAPAASH